MRLDIIIEKGQHQGQRLSVNRPGIYLIGRKVDADLVLTKDRAVSRQHCRIELTEAGVCRIADISRGGSFVNGSRIQRFQLATGDMIKVGQTVMRVSLSGGAPRIPGFILEEPFEGVGPGKTWSATSDLLDQPVALHFLALDPTEETKANEPQRRFLREAGICARTIHPGLLNFLDQNISGDILWFATELVIATGKNKRIKSRVIFFFFMVFLPRSSLQDKTGKTFANSPVFPKNLAYFTFPVLFTADNMFPFKINFF